MIKVPGLFELHANEASTYNTVGLTGCCKSSRAQIFCSYVPDNFLYIDVTDVFVKRVVRRWFCDKSNTIAI